MAIWKEIKGYKGYWVSDEGQVRSIDRIVPMHRHNQIEYKKIKGKLIKPQTDKYGYQYIVFGFCGNKKRKTAKNIEREGLSLCGLKVSGCTMLAPRTPLL